MVRFDLIMAEDVSNTSKQTKKRTRNPSEWKREKRKRLRVAGKSYINTKGDLVHERKIGDDCKCRRKCYEVVPEEVRNKLFDGYYSLNSHDEQNAYLFGLIRKHDIARKRCKDSDRRTCSYKYFVRLRGKEVQVCRLAFAHIHGISPHKIRILCQKQDQNIMYPHDGRGKHDNRPRKVSEETLIQIKEHIYSIVKSERVRDFLKDEKHSGPDVNITKMWKDFLSKYDPNYSEVLISNEKTDDEHQRNNHELRNDSLQISIFPGSESQALAQQNMSYSDSVDLSQYQLPSVGDNLELLGATPTQFVDAEGQNCRRKEDNQPTPIVKHWLYSKVFHDEFKLHDFLALKKKLCMLKDTDRTSTSHQSKSERKQKSPKKLSREKQLSDSVTNVQNHPNIAASDIITDNGHHQMHPLSSTSSSDMYILPDMSHLNPSNEMLPPQHHSMQLNLHTFASQQSGVLNPLVHTPPQCPTMMSSIGMGQSQCDSYAPVTSFYH